MLTLRVKLPLTIIALLVGLFSVDSVSAEDHSKETVNYVHMVQNIIKAHWSPPKFNGDQDIKILFKIAENGKAKIIELVNPSGNKEYDQSCIAAIKQSSPFPKYSKTWLKDEKNKEFLIEFNFNYNLVKSSAEKEKIDYIKQIHNIINLNWQAPEEDYLGTGTINFTVLSEREIDIHDLNLVSTCPLFKDSCIQAIKNSIPLPNFPISLKDDVEANGPLVLKHKFLHCPKQMAQINNRDLFIIKAKGLLTDEKKQILAKLGSLLSSDFIPCYTLMRKNNYPEEFANTSKITLDMHYRLDDFKFIVDVNITKEYPGLKVLGTEVRNHVVKVFKDNMDFHKKLIEKFSDSNEFLFISIYFDTNDF